MSGAQRATGLRARVASVMSSLRHETSESAGYGEALTGGCHHRSVDDDSDAEIVSLDEVISLVDQLDSGDEDWEELQWHAADGLHDRFLECGNHDDLAAAIERAEQVVTAQKENSPAHLLDLSLMVWTRFEEDHERRDVEGYVRLNERALSLCQADPAYAHLVATCQANLATGLMSRKRFEPDPQDQDRAVELWEAALASGDLDDDARAGVHANIAQAVSSAGHTVRQLDAALEHGRLSLTRSTADADDLAQRHFSLANALTSRAERAPAPGLVEEAVQHTRSGLELLGQDHPDYPGYCVNLATQLRSLARETGSVAPLDEAETLVREEILPRVEAGDTDHVLALTMSAAILSELAHWRDDNALHAEALDLYQAAITAADEGSHELGIALVNLASAARDASDRLDDPRLLDLGIQAGERSLAVFTVPGLHRAAALTATSNLLRDRFVVRGHTDDLDRAMSIAEESLDLTPTGHQEYAARQTNMAVLLSDDYAERATRENLDRAIVLYRAALDSPELLARRVAERENDLALAMRDRHKESGLTQDLDDAVEHAERAVENVPPAAVAWAGYANNYANALADRFDASGDVADLRHAIDLFRQAQQSAQARIAEASGYGANLALGLADLAAVTGRVAHLQEGVKTMGASLAQLPPEHPERAYRLANLGDLLRQQSQLTYADVDGDLDQAQALATAAVTTAAEGAEAAGSSDARLLPALANQARAMRWARALGIVTWGAVDVLDVQRRAAQLVKISPGERFGQCAAWAVDAREAGHEEDVLAAYGQAVALTPEVAWVGLTTGERMRLLGMMSEVLVEAVHAALAADMPWVGLAWADQVRAVIGRQEVLVRSIPATQAWARESLGSRLIAPRTASASEPSRPVRERNAREARRAGAHLQARELHLTSVEPTTYKQLRFPGWLVLLVPGDESSCALIVDGREGTSRTVKLAPRAPDLAARVQQLRAATGRFAHSYTDASDGEMLSHELQARHEVFAVLAWLWESVVRPVLDEVPEHEQDAVLRVWWSPVGDFALLPLHAAGFHPQSPAEWEKAGEVACFDCASRSVVSSYLPTVAPLTPHRVTRKSHSGDSLLFVGVSDQERGTPDISSEVESIRRAWPGGTIDDLLEDSATTVAVAAGVSKHTFLHVAAHGTGSDESPTGAGFRLSDDVFTWAELAGCDAPCGRLAIFLTCDAASGNGDAPNEALHLAAAAQQAGFLDVVATLVPLRESSAAYAVRGIYGSVARDPATVNERVATVVADVANRLRLDPDYGSDPLMWVPYAHFGWGLSESPWGTAG